MTEPGEVPPLTAEQADEIARSFLAKPEPTERDKQGARLFAQYARGLRGEISSEEFLALRREELTDAEVLELRARLTPETDD